MHVFPNDCIGPPPGLSEYHPKHAFSDSRIYPVWGQTTLKTVTYCTGTPPLS